MTIPLDVAAQFGWNFLPTSAKGSEWFRCSSFEGDITNKSFRNSYNSGPVCLNSHKIRAICKCFQVQMECTQRQQCLACIYCAAYLFAQYVAANVCVCMAHFVQRISIINVYIRSLDSQIHSIHLCGRVLFIQKTFSLFIRFEWTVQYSDRSKFVRFELTYFGSAIS